jgi:hypothetical protein
MGSAEELTEPPIGSEEAVPPMGSPAADGVAARGLGEGGIVAGTKDGEPSIPMGAMESLSGELFLSLLVGLEWTESWGGPPKAAPSSRKLRAEIGTILFVPSGYIFRISAWSGLRESGEYALFSEVG